MQDYYMGLQNALQMRGVHQVAMWVHTTKDHEIHHLMN
jgi:hypothetical protein